MIEKNYSISGDVFLTIAHISDLHNKDGRQAIESMRNRKPDIIVITGDLVLRRRPKDDMLIVQSERNVLPFLSECAQIAPTYMSLGNHEVMLNQDDLELISQTGVELLDNRFVKTDKYVIGGLTSAYVSRLFIVKFKYRKRACKKQSRYRSEIALSRSRFGVRECRSRIMRGWIHL